METRVLERDHGLPGERGGGHRRFLSNSVAERARGAPKLRRPVVSASSSAARPRLQVADPTTEPSARTKKPAAGARRLDRGLDDHEQQLLGIERRGERVAEPVVRLAQALPLVLEVRQPLLELLRHLVEGAPEPPRTRRGR